MTIQDNATIALLEYDAFNNRHTNPRWLDYTTDIVAGDCTVVDVPSSMTFRGPAGVRRFLRGLVTAFPDSRVEVTNLDVTEKGAVVEYVRYGTHAGLLESPAGVIPPTGRSIRLPLCDVYRFADGLIVSRHIYYDVVTLLKQLGFLTTVQTMEDKPLASPAMSEEDDIWEWYEE